jgi:N,N-dimethylformamidase
MQKPRTPSNRRRFLSVAGVTMVAPLLDGCGDNTLNQTVSADAPLGQIPQRGDLAASQKAATQRTRGVFFGVDPQKQLRWHQYLGLDANNNPVWHPNSGAVVGTGWDFKTLVAADDGVIFAVAANGLMHWYQYTGDAGQFSWHPNSGNRVGHGWYYTRLTYSGDGQIYAINAQGDMHWYRYEGGSGGFRWHPASGQKVGHGWSYAQVVGGGNGVIYGTTAAGQLHWYQDIARNGGSHWAARSEAVLGHGWLFTHLLSQGDGTLFAVDSMGNVSRYRDMARDGTQDWDKGNGMPLDAKLPYAQLMVAFNNNALPGGGAIAAYVGPSLSFAPGDPLSLHVSTLAESYSVTFFKGGVPNGETNTGLAKTELSFDNLTGTLQATPPQAWGEGCAWPASVQTTVPSTWGSGIYAARLQDSLGEVSWASFVVRPAANAAKRRYAVLANVNTWNAYNAWGGRSNYTSISGVRLAFDRPSNAAYPVDSTRNRRVASGGGAGAQEHLVVAELWAHRWMREQGFEFDVYSDTDLERGALSLADYPSLVLVAHPEYWSVAMHDKLESHLSQPQRNLFYLGGNGLYESVSYARDLNTMVMRRGDESLTRSDALFAGPGVNKPQARLLGIAFTGQNYNTHAPFQVQQADHRYFAGTGLKNGDLFGESGLLGAASGHEVDGRVAASPQDLTVLARGTNKANNDTFAAEMVVFSAVGGGVVFSVGSLSFTGALSNDAAISTIVKNALREG